MIAQLQQQLYQWWRNIDQKIIFALLLLFSMSVMLVATAGPMVAKRIGLEGNYFAIRQLYYLLAAIIIIFTLSVQDPQQVKRIAIIGFAVNILLLILVKFIGYEVKGATRWISLGSFSLQPSEFMKPLFAVTSGWLLSIRREHSAMLPINMLVFLVVSALIVMQPDLGMTVVIVAIWGIQLFVAGLPMIWIVLMAILGAGALVSAYLFFPHVAQRIDGFLDPDSSDNFQISKSIASFEEGGLFGVGPGEGVVKQSLPDAHTDFIFAVAGEEFGAIACILISAIFLFIVIRALTHVLTQRDKFIILAVSGLVGQFGIQAFINMGVALHLLPTKGMTLPFISFGGSSTLAMALTIGFTLSLLRKHIDINNLALDNVDYDI